MHTTTEIPSDEAERTAGILEDRHAARADHPAGVHLTTQARELAEAVIAGFQMNTPAHWQLVASSLTDDPAMLDSFAATHGLPRPIDAVKCRAIAIIESAGLAAALSPIPPAAQRPVCVTVEWLESHPTFAAQLEYLDGEHGWKPAADAVRGIDPCWPVEVRQAMHVVGR